MKPVTSFVLIMLGLAAILAIGTCALKLAGNNSDSHKSAPQTKNLPPTMIVSKNPTVTTVTNGVTLKWTSVNTTKCEMFTNNNAGVAQRINGDEHVVYPTKTTTYKIVCEGPNGTTAESSVTVTINDSSPAPIPCHGMKGFHKVDPNSTDTCTGWSREGLPLALGSDGICAISCQNIYGESVPTW